MRQIGHLQDETQAKRFGHYLYGQGIENHVEANPDGQWEIWVLDDDNLDDATAHLDRFKQRPDDPVYAQAAKAAARQKTRDERTRRPKRARVVDGRTIFYRPPAGLGTVTIVLIVISAAVSFATNLGQDGRLLQLLSITEYQHDDGYIQWNSHLPEIRRGQVWRLFTPMFLHFGLIHVLFNMLWLRDLGSMVEAHRGRFMLVLLVLVIAATSNVAQYAVSGPAFGGMSGVVFGLLGYVWMQSRFNPASGLFLQPQTVTLMIIWFFICLFGFMGHIANTAHAVGAAVGIAWGFTAARYTRWRRLR